MESRKIRQDRSFLLHETLARCWRRFELFGVLLTLSLSMSLHLPLTLFLCREKDNVSISSVLKLTFLLFLTSLQTPVASWAI